MDVEVQGLNFGFASSSGADWVFRDFDLTVKSQSMHSIVGASGCGKSTLLRLISGLEKPVGGTIDLVGTPRAAQRTALVFQNPALLPWWDVGRNVGFGVEFDKSRAPLYEKIRSFNLDRVGLGGLSRRRPGTLSRGQQTKASIGRAMAYDADVTLLDEPFVHLDAMSKRHMWREFETHWQLDARTYILVTHDIEEAVLLSDHITVLSRSTPTSIVETIDVGIRRPRTLDTMTEPAFRSAVSRVWDALDVHDS
ncbi:MAG: ABC-type nitrate/sulfonate/bicarbonate transport system ATPase subunit [Verrucomicrobiales bacterium]|jgi:ABC-type nitrate/sulfonate/bicarbonate transport system ATPase subunit